MTLTRAELRRWAKSQGKNYGVNGNSSSKAIRLAMEKSKSCNSNEAIMANGPQKADAKVPSEDQRTLPLAPRLVEQADNLSSPSNATHLVEGMVSQTSCEIVKGKSLEERKLGARSNRGKELAPPPSCIPKTEDLCLLLSQLSIQDPPQWGPVCSKADVTTIKEVVQRLSTQKRAKLCRKGLIEYDLCLRDIDNDVSENHEISKLLGLLEKVALMAHTSRKPGALFGLHMQVMNEWKAAGHVRLLDGSVMHLLGGPFDGLQSAASVHGFTDQLASLWCRTLSEVFENSQSELTIPQNVLEVLYDFAPQGLPFRPHESNDDAASKSAQDCLKTGATQFIIHHQKKTFSQVFATYCSRRDRSKKRVDMEQKRMQNEQNRNGEGCANENVNHIRKVKLVSEKSRSVLGVLSDGNMNLTSSGTKLSGKIAGTESNLNDLTKTSKSNCYHCKRMHENEVVFVFEDGMPRKKFACRECAYAASKRRFDDRDSDSSDSEQEYSTDIYCLQTNAHSD